MSAKSTIEWTDASYTPIRARVKANAGEIAAAKGFTSLIQIATKMQGHVGPHCEKVSPGCERCYSEHANCRCLPSNGTGLPFDRRSRDLVDVFVDEKILEQPLHWKRPRRIFVCSQTDLFADFVTDDMIDRVFAVMALCPQHTFQVLTKRARRMFEWVSGVRGAQRYGDINEHARDLWARRTKIFRSSCGIAVLPTQRHGMVPNNWPLPNVWLGVSVEDQQRADERIPHLLETPAAVRFLSCEPLLGPVDLYRYMPWTDIKDEHFKVGLDWVIVGGESGGRTARPMHPDWTRHLRRQCLDARVPFFFKQWGEWLPVDQFEATGGVYLLHQDAAIHRDGAVTPMPYYDSHARLRGEGMEQVSSEGKGGSGRILDGRTWDQFPGDSGVELQARKYFAVSWLHRACGSYQETQEKKPWIPLTSGTSKDLIGWWFVNHISDLWLLMYALVAANSPASAKQIVARYWPERGRIRFCEEVAGDWAHTHIWDGTQEAMDGCTCVKCSKCHGSGRLPYDGSRCKSCHGVGVLKHCRICEEFKGGKSPFDCISRQTWKSARGVQCR